MQLPPHLRPTNQIRSDARILKIPIWTQERFTGKLGPSGYNELSYDFEQTCIVGYHLVDNQCLSNRIWDKDRQRALGPEHGSEVPTLLRSISFDSVNISVKVQRSTWIFILEKDIHATKEELDVHGK